jgi:TetR/AcrR family transcriptional regulator, transcriptional repressor for nem operon
MRYTKEHKKQVRLHLLAETAGYAKKHGFGASSVNDLASAAGLTTGSLYKHFEDKNALFIALIKAELDRNLSRIAGIKSGDLAAIRNSMSSYLGINHVNAAEVGCVVPALAAEISRASNEVRMTFEEGIFELKKTLENLVGSSDLAWTLIAQGVGAVVIARAMLQESSKREIIGAVKRTGEKLL